MHSSECCQYSGNRIKEKPQIPSDDLFCASINIVFNFQFCLLRDVKMFLDMPVILIEFENLVSSNNKICSRNINFL